MQCYNTIILGGQCNVILTQYVKKPMQCYINSNIKKPM